MGFGETLYQSREYILRSLKMCPHLFTGDKQSRFEFGDLHKSAKSRGNRSLTRRISSAEWESLAFLILVIQPKFELLARDPIFAPNFVLDRIGNDLGQVRGKCRDGRECRGFSVFAAHTNLDVEVA